MKALKWIGIGLGGLVALFLLVAALLPSSYEITRTGRLDAPPAVV
jgi:hypothetical protein